MHEIYPFVHFNAHLLHSFIYGWELREIFISARDILRAMGLYNMLFSCVSCASERELWGAGGTDDKYIPSKPMPHDMAMELTLTEHDASRK